MAATLKCICVVDLITAIDTGVKCHVIDHFEVPPPFHWEIRAQGQWQSSVHGDEGISIQLKDALTGKMQ